MLTLLKDIILNDSIKPSLSVYMLYLNDSNRQRGESYVIAWFLGSTAG